MKLQQIIDILEEIAPPQYAASWDNSGLQVGSPEAEVSSILVALDITEGVIREGARKKTDLIVTHHPLFFHPLSRLQTNTGIGKLLPPLLQAGISVYAAHTNLDVAAGGVNDQLGRALKIARWKELPGGRTSEVKGFGGIGKLEAPRRITEIITDLKKSLKIPTVRLVGSKEKTVQKIAFCCGSGADLFPEVCRAAPDLFITGDLKYHDAMNFLLEGIPALDLGHFASEAGIRKPLAEKIRQAIYRKGEHLTVQVSRTERDPFQFI
ncbi:MAG: Nif3-like dinuclear metal center hexameric protein [Deltaproteobacteria bacterium]|nr:Nif3-like dinuclear metal center hexameric protein [Deltaproteobacteria bacterium]